MSAIRPHLPVLLKKYLGRKELPTPRLQPFPGHLTPNNWSIWEHKSLASLTQLVTILKGLPTSDLPMRLSGASLGLPHSCLLPLHILFHALPSHRCWYQRHNLINPLYAQLLLRVSFPRMQPTIFYPTTLLLELFDSFSWIYK